MCIWTSFFDLDKLSSFCFLTLNFLLLYNVHTSRSKTNLIFIPNSGWVRIWESLEKWVRQKRHFVNLKVMCVILLNFFICIWLPVWSRGKIIYCRARYHKKTRKGFDIKQCWTKKRWSIFAFRKWKYFRIAIARDF